jgi:hypothetical protein
MPTCPACGSPIGGASELMARRLQEVSGGEIVGLASELMARRLPFRGQHPRTRDRAQGALSDFDFPAIEFGESRSGRIEAFTPFLFKPSAFIMRQGNADAVVLLSFKIGRREQLVHSCPLGTLLHQSLDFDTVNVGEAMVLELTASEPGLLRLQMRGLSLQ